MEEQTVQLRLKDLTVITGSLKSIVSKSFGPKGGHALIVSSTGQMTVTHDGASILSTLHLSHPIAKLIVDSARSFDKTYGDGCKTFIIYVHGLLSAIDQSYANLDFSSSDDLAYRNSALRSLYEFTNNDLFSICEEVQENVQKCQETTSLEYALHYIILPCFSGLPAKVGNHLTRSVATLMQIAETEHNLHVILHFLDNLLLNLPNQLYMNSHISDGLFLQGSFFGQKSSGSGTKIIFMQCPLEGFVDKESTDAVSVTCTSRESFFTYRAQVARNFLHGVKSSGVSLILTTHAEPGYVVQICNEFNINILACLDNKDLEFATYITGKSPISSIYDNFSEENNIAAVDCWESVVIAGKQFVKVVFDNLYTSYTPKTMFLCAPTESLCQQLELLVKKSVKVVNSCFSRSLSTSIREIVYSGLVYNGPVMCSGLNASEASLNSSPHSKQLSAEQITNKELHLNEKFGSKPSQLILKNIIAGGGYFENVLTHFLHRYNQKDISWQKHFCCRIIMKMLEAVPKVLFDNICPSQSRQGRNFLCKQKEIMEAINSEANTQIVCSSLENGVVDVLNIKFEVLFAAINLVVELLRIDAVVGVKRLVKEDIQESQ